MPRQSIVFALVAVFALAANAPAADIPVITANGVVEKTTKDSLTFLPRKADGKFDRSVVLKVTGTSKITIVGTRMSGKKLVLTQREADIKALQKNQKVSIIYVRGKEGNILLSAVAQPSSR
jgi:hypothetical protein